MGDCSRNSSNINETIIIDTLAGSCDGMYTNLLGSCSGNTAILLGDDTVIFSGDVSGTTFYSLSSISDTISATTISAVTFYGDGSQLSGISTDNFYTTASTLNNNIAYFNRNDTLSAYTLDLSGLANQLLYLTGGTLSGSLYGTTISAGTISATTFYGDGSQLSGISTDNFYTTASTLINKSAYFDRNDVLSAYTLNLDSFAYEADLTAHTSNISNPHQVTAAQVGAYSASETDNKFVYKSGDTMTGGLISPSFSSTSLTSNTIYAHAISGMTPLLVNGAIIDDGSITASTLTAATISANTYFSGGTDLLNVINALEKYTSGTTLYDKTAYFDRNDVLSAYTLNLNSFSYQSDLTSHTGNTSNPHQVTAAQVGAYASGYTDTNFVHESGDTMSGNLTILPLTGTTLRTVHVTSGGTLVVGDELDNLYISATTIIALLTANTNWNWSVYTGATLTGITDGMRYVTSAYTYEMLSSVMYRNAANDYYTTGSTLYGKTAYFNRNDSLSAYSLNLSAFAYQSDFTSHTGDTSIHHTLPTLDARYVNITGDTMTGSLTVNGDFFVNGTTFSSHTENVYVSANTININDGEVGSGVTKGYAGIVVDRGALDNYLFVFDEPTDTFRVGKTGDTQAVATREDNPIDTAIPYWNDSINRFDTSTGLTWNNGLHIAGSGGTLFEISGSTGVAFGVDASKNTVVYGNLILNSSVNTGLTAGINVVATVPKLSGTAAFFDYCVYSGTSMRAGNIASVWDGTNVEFNETSTTDLGVSTSAVTFSADVSGPDVRLLGMISSGTWGIKIGTRII